MSRWGRIGAMAAGLWLAAALPTQAASPFSNWAAVVVAGDWHAHSGGPTEAFDNARRDVALALQRAGFEAGNTRQFSVRPGRYRDSRPARAEIETIANGLADLSAQASDGCFIYVTSHGTQDGVLVDEDIVTPARLAAIIDRACPSRPSVVVMSACFSGVFIPALAQSDRMILTAAQHDRTSFGCGEADRYPYFDACFLQEMPRAREFVGLARAIQTCVAERERLEGMEPPSEPQIWIGPRLKPLIPLTTFAPPPLKADKVAANRKAP